MRPPVPKAKLLLEQAGSEHRASARGKGGDSGVWKGASKGGNAPITGPFPPPGGHGGESRGRKGIKRRPLFPKGTGNGSVKEKASALAEAFQINLGVVLLSHTRVCSIMGDEELDYRVRNGIGYTLFSMDTKEMSKMYN